MAIYSPVFSGFQFFKAKAAKKQIKKDLLVINSDTFVSTDKGLDPEQFRAVVLETFTMGPKDGVGYDHVVDYLSDELHEIYKTWSEIHGN